MGNHPEGGSTPAASTSCAPQGRCDKVPELQVGSRFYSVKLPDGKFNSLKKVQLKSLTKAVENRRILHHLLLLLSTTYV